jgi:FKBP-type peptidyl-prolyl cis-trans isomerase SlyD
MTIAKDCLVHLDYRLTDSAGNLLNPDDDALIYLHGRGQIFKKVEAALEGQKVGHAISVDLAPHEAFGEYDETLVAEEPLDDLPEELCVGMELDGYLDERPDETVIYTVTQISDECAVLDANHPLAGERLCFEGTVREIQQLDAAAVKEILEHEHDHDH